MMGHDDILGGKDKWESEPMLCLRVEDANQEANVPAWAFHDHTWTRQPVSYAPHVLHLEVERRSGVRWGNATPVTFTAMNVVVSGNETRLLTLCWFSVTYEQLS